MWLVERSKNSYNSHNCVAPSMFGFVPTHPFSSRHAFSRHKANAFPGSVDVVLGAERWSRNGGSIGPFKRRKHCRSPPTIANCLKQPGRSFEISPEVNRRARPGCGGKDPALWLKTLEEPGAKCDWQVQAFCLS